MHSVEAAAGAAVLGTIGRKRVQLALADGGGGLRPDTIRSYSAEETIGVSGALTTFQRDLSIPALPARSAIAVAGLARGDAISITRTRWFLSRSGLQAMLGEAPLILNDFAAEAWAMYSADVRPLESFAGAPVAVRQPGCYLVAGITSGLGVAVFNHSQAGQVSVMPTEAGHGGFVAGSAAIAKLAADLFPGRHPVLAEDIVSAPGLQAIYELLVRQGGGMVRARTPEDITRSMTVDPMARRACEVLAEAFWSQIGNLVVTFGAWDGVVVTGGLAGAIRPILRRPDLQAAFVGAGKYARVLGTVPRCYGELQHAALIGAAEALRHGA